MAGERRRQKCENGGNKKTKTGPAKLSTAHFFQRDDRRPLRSIAAGRDATRNNNYNTGPTRRSPITIISMPPLFETDCANLMSTSKTTNCRMTTSVGVLGKPKRAEWYANPCTAFYTKERGRSPQDARCKIRIFFENI